MEGKWLPAKSFRKKENSEKKKVVGEGRGHDATLQKCFVRCFTFSKAKRYKKAVVNLEDEVAIWKDVAAHAMEADNGG